MWVPVLFMFADIDSVFSRSWCVNATQIRSNLLQVTFAKWALEALYPLRVPA